MLIFRINPDFVTSFVIISGQNALLPPVVMAIRATTGKMREFFWVLFFLFAATAAIPVWAYLLGLRLPVDLISCMIAGTLAGIAAGCVLVHFGKIHPKAL